MKPFRANFKKVQAACCSQWMGFNNGAQSTRQNFSSENVRQKFTTSTSPLNNVFSFPVNNVSPTPSFAALHPPPRPVCPTHPELENVFQLYGTDASAWTIENVAKEFCAKYSQCEKSARYETIMVLAKAYGVQHNYVVSLSQGLSQVQKTKEIFDYERRLKAALLPMYHWLFVMLGRLEHGVKFLVNLRTDVLELQASTSNKFDYQRLVELNNTLQELLFQWFSLGFLQLERVTWESPCDIIEKVSEYEAIHPIKSWLDIKRRVGPCRRCYIFTHPSMPREPIVVLHTVLCDSILASVQEVEELKSKNASDFMNESTFSNEDKSKITTAVFYSISSTQKGLLGIQLGNYIIGQVISKITGEFPMIHQFSSLSPIPGFKDWFSEKLQNNMSYLFTESEYEALKTVLSANNINSDLHLFFQSALWKTTPGVSSVLKRPFLRACAFYLCKEKKMMYALNRVANFHLRNGAMIWRINWMANPSLKGTVQSFCLMVNYRYFLEKQEEYSKEYVDNGTIHASDGILELVKEADELLQENNYSNRQ